MARQARPVADIAEGTFQPALRALDLVRVLPHDPSGQIMARQLAQRPLGGLISEADETTWVLTATVENARQQDGG